MKLWFFWFSVAINFLMLVLVLFLIICSYYVGTLVGFVRLLLRYRI